MLLYDKPYEYQSQVYSGDVCSNREYTLQNKA